jgi:hypothetical protein
MTYKNSDFRVDAVVSEEQAGEFMAKANGQGGVFANGGQSGSSGGYGGGHQSHPATSQNAGIAALESQVKKEVGIALSPEQIHQNIEVGGDLDRSKIDPYKMLDTAGRNHPVTISVDNAVDAVISHPITKEIKKDAEAVMDYFHHENHNPPSDNDLPPIPKE